MKSYELLVFDWDGTLMDSAGEIVGSMQQAIQDTGLPERTPAQMRELIGLGLNDVLARLFPELDTRKVRARLDDYRRRYGVQRSRAVGSGGSSVPRSTSCHATRSSLSLLLQKAQRRPGRRGCG